MIVKADKGKTTVITKTDEYTNKVHNFLTKNNFHKFPQDPTKQDHQGLLKIMRHGNLIIDKHHIRHLTQKDPKPPTLNAQI
jgi:hypothetical protein